MEQVLNGSLDAASIETELYSALLKAVKEWKRMKNPDTDELLLKTALPKLAEGEGMSPESDWILAKALVGASLATNSGREGVDILCDKRARFVQSQFARERKERREGMSRVASEKVPPKRATSEIDWPTLCPSVFTTFPAINGLVRDNFSEFMSLPANGSGPRRPIFLDNRSGEQLLKALDKLFPSGARDARNFLGGMRVIFNDGIAENSNTREFLTLLMEEVFRPPFFISANAGDPKAIYEPDVVGLATVTPERKRQVGKAMGLAILMQTPLPGRIMPDVLSVLLGRTPAQSDLQRQAFEDRFSPEENYFPNADPGELELPKITDPLYHQMRDKYIQDKLEAREADFKRVGKDLIEGFQEFLAPQTTVPKRIVTSRLFSLMISGSPSISTTDFERHTTVLKPGKTLFGKVKVLFGGKTQEDKVISWFWKIVHKDLSPNDLRGLLFLITGSRRLPYGGFSALSQPIKLQILNIPSRIKKYNGTPRASTREFRLSIPTYSSEKELHSALLAAIQHPAIVQLD